MRPPLWMRPRRDAVEDRCADRSAASRRTSSARCGCPRRRCSRRRAGGRDSYDGESAIPSRPPSPGAVDPVGPSRPSDPSPSGVTRLMRAVSRSLTSAEPSGRNARAQGTAKPPVTTPATLADRTAVSSGVGDCSVDSDALALVEVEVDGVSVGAACLRRRCTPRSGRGQGCTGRRRVASSSEPYLRSGASPLRGSRKRQIVIACGLGAQAAHSRLCGDGWRRVLDELSSERERDTSPRARWTNGSGRAGLAALVVVALGAVTAPRLLGKGDEVRESAGPADPVERDVGGRSPRPRQPLSALRVDGGGTGR